VNPQSGVIPGSGLVNPQSGVIPGSGLVNPQSGVIPGSGLVNPQSGVHPQQAFNNQNYSGLGGPSTVDMQFGSKYDWHYANKLVSLDLDAKLAILRKVGV
jgi:hypothetical protein